MKITNAVKNKEGRNSKTKIGAVLIAAGPVLVTVGSIITGDMQLLDGIIRLSTQVGAVLAVFGIRDLPILNQLQKLDTKKKK